MKKLLVCLLLVGCAGDDDSSGGGSPVALDNFGTAIGTASCHKQFECCSDAEIMAQYMGITYMGQPITTEQQCVDFTTGFLATFLVDEYKTSLAAGRIEYDAAAAGNCISVMERISCADYAAAVAGTGKPTALVSCKSPVTGKVENGGVCAQDYECTSDNCVKTGSSNDGTCQPIPTAGQPCDFTCADGLYCDFDTTTAMETCQAKKANDAQCDSDDQCTSDNCDKTTRVCTTKPIVCDGR
jgi:hypothetical protein